VGNNLGERRRRDENDNQLQKRRLPRHRRLCHRHHCGGERRFEVISLSLLSLLSLSREDNDVGQREGRGIMTTIAEGEVASSLSSKGVGKDLGKRVAVG
jgi:hypothetical protein